MTTNLTEFSRILHFREIALRILDGCEPQPQRKFHIADAICAYEGPVPSGPHLMIATMFVCEALNVIEGNDLEKKARKFNSYLVDHVAAHQKQLHLNKYTLKNNYPGVTIT